MGFAASASGSFSLNRCGNSVCHWPDLVIGKEKPPQERVVCRGRLPRLAPGNVEGHKPRPEIIPPTATKGNTMSQYNKAIVALVMALIGIANTFFNAGVNISPETVNTVVALLTPLLVYIVPNKPKAE